MGAEIRDGNTILGGLTKDGIEYTRDAGITMDKRGARSCTSEGTIDMICKMDDSGYPGDGDRDVGQHDFILLENMPGGKGDSGGPIFQSGFGSYVGAIVTNGKDPDPNGSPGVRGPALYQMPLTPGGGSRF